MRTFSSFAALADAKGEALGTSQWFTITQADIDTFAKATGDHQWIHVDPARAAEGPFGSTIAHGYLTLSLLPRVWHQIYEVKGVRHAVNYGLNKVRFPTPVPVDSEVRGASTIIDVVTVGDDAIAVTLSTIIEVKGISKPACIAESIARYIG